MRIAVEEHVNVLHEPEYAEIAAEINSRINFPSTGNDPERWKKLLSLLFDPDYKNRLKVMDEAGIDIQVLSSQDICFHNDTDVERAARNVRLINDRLYSYSQQCPERFKVFGSLPMQNPQAAVAEIERCHNKYGFPGFMVPASCCGEYYDDMKFDPIWDALEKFDMPLYLHASNREASQTLIYSGYPEMLASTWDWGVFTGTVVLRLVFGGVFERHPGVKVIIGHMGEHLPYLLGRLDEGASQRGIPFSGGRISHLPSYYIRKNIYITTSGGYLPETMRCAVSAMGVNHILFACDYPHLDLIPSINQVEACSDLSSIEKEMIYHGSAEQLLHI